MCRNLRKKLNSKTPYQFDNYINFTHFKTKLLFRDWSKFNFSKTTDSSKNLNEIKEKLKKEGIVKIYDSKYQFNSEKLMIHGSLVFLIISSSTIVFTNVSIWLKLINTFFLFIPSFLIQLEYFINNTRFINSLELLPNNKIQLTDMWGGKEIIEIKNLSKASDDPRIKSYNQSFNNQTFIIFTNKENKALYHSPRDGVYWDEGLFHDIIEGKQLN